MTDKPDPLAEAIAWYNKHRSGSYSAMFELVFRAAKAHHAQTAQQVEQEKTEWVKCPVCDEDDMRKTTDADGNSLIHCVNHGCLSNGAQTAPTDSELLPCPFCGSADVEVEDQEGHNDWGDCRITCNDCMARSDVFTPEDGDRVQAAIRAWNRRAATAPVPGDVWQDISTAPKHGTSILGYEPGGGMAVVNWINNSWRDHHGSQLHPEFWMPLPKPHNQNTQPTPAHLDASPLGPEELLPCLFGCAAQLDEHEGKTCSGHYTSQVRCSSGCEVAGAVGWGHTRDEANEKAIESWHARQGAANGN